MIVAFCLYKYFPYGGLQRDFMRVAQAVAARGHTIRVFTLEWQGKRPDAFEIIIVPTTASTNHGKNAQYHCWVSAYLKKHPVDRVVGFNKMPRLDVYYAADVCYAEKVAREKGVFYKLTGRYRHYSAYEKAAFARGLPTQLLMLTNTQINEFRKHYHTEDSRFHILPPGIDPERKYDSQIVNSRQIARHEHGIGPDQYLVLQVGSDFKRKGVERALRAVAALRDVLRQKTVYMVVGQDRPVRYQTLANKLGIIDSVRFFAGRDDIAALMSAADLLIHPAIQESAGIVLLEAVVAGLPVLVTEVCGYAHYIATANCGLVIPEPFTQSQLDSALCLALENGTLRTQWAQNARYFADITDLYSLPEKAADIISGGKYG